MRTWRWALVLVPALAGFASAGGPEPPAPATLLDFETGEPAEGWEQVADVDLTELSLEAGTTPSSGRALGIAGRGKRGHLVRRVEVADWRPYRALSFHAKVIAEKPVPMRILAAEGTSFRAWLRRFTLEPGEWREVVLPLSEFRADHQRMAGRIDRVGRIVIQLDEGAGEVLIDDVRLLPGDRGLESWRPTVEERLATSFPKGDGRAIESEHFVVLTNVRDLKGKRAEKLLARLEEGLALLRTRFRISGELPTKAPLVIHATEEEWREGVQRIGAHFGVSVSKPGGTGLSLFDVATSFWDPKQKEDRPVYVHEAMHAALARLLHIVPNGDWVQEGLASAVQCSLHPESMKDDLGQRFEERAAGRGGGFPPLGDLLREERPGLGRYPQLFTLFEFLAERHAEELPALWAALGENHRLPHESGIPALEKALGLPFEKIAEEWLAFGLERY